MISIGIYGTSASDNFLTYIEKYKADQMKINRTFYLARQSISSIISSKIIECKEIIGDSKFEQQLMELDFNKTVFDTMKRKQSDFILLDFLDERFDLIRIKGSYITGSYELLNSNYLEGKEYELIKKLEFYRNNQSLFCKHIDEFCNRLMSLYKEEQIILHEAYFADSFYDQEGNLQSFSQQTLSYNQSYNSMLRFIYCEMKKRIKNGIVLNAKQWIADGRKGNVPSTILYEKEYYEKLYEKFCTIKKIKEAMLEEKTIIEAFDTTALEGMDGVNYLVPVYSRSLRYHDFILNVRQIADKAVEGEIVLRTKTIVLRQEPLWEYQFQDKVASNRLYLFSLDWVGCLLEAYEQTKKDDYLKKADHYIRSFIAWYGLKEDKVEIAYSSDQAYYIRINILLYAKKVFPKDWDLLNQVEQVLKVHTVWLAKERNFQVNNHGTMATIALLYMSIYYQKNHIGDTLKKIAIDRILLLVNTIFDEEGMCNENSAEYSEFNIELVERIIQILKHYEIAPKEVEVLTIISERAKRVNSILLRQDNKFPPIGDSSIRKSKFQSRQGHYFFQMSNVVILKDDQLYFSYKCGFTTLVHKHADDMSFTLRYGKTDLIVDSGLFCYDKTNPCRIYIESCRGHARIYPESIQDCISTLYGSVIKQAYIKTYREETNQIIIESICSFQSGMTIHRDITVKDYKIIIHDWWNSDCEDTIHVRFPIYPEAKMITINPTGCCFQNKEMVVTISFETSIPNSLCRLEKGWYSEETQKVMEGKAIDIVIPPSKEGSVTTYVDYQSF